MPRKAELGWRGWIYGLLHVIKEGIIQRAFTRHLPQRLPLPLLTDVACIVTGATSGIGLEVAKQLAEAGAHVVLACRNTMAAHALMCEWQTDQGKNGASLNIEVMELNLLSLSSVRSFAATWETRRCPLHILINNAGIFSMAAPQKLTEDGYEEHMQVNHLAPALLSMLLLPSLLRAASSRVVNVNSDMHYLGSIDPDDLMLNSGKRKYSSSVAYSASKLAQIYFNSMLQNKLPKDSAVHIVLVNPGTVKTNVIRTLPQIVQATYHLVGVLSFSPLEGARSVIFCATDSQLPKYTTSLRTEGWPLCALFSSDCKPGTLAKQAQDTDMMVSIWKKTLESIGLSEDYLEKVITDNDVALLQEKTSSNNG